MRVALYCRVSTDEQTQGRTIESQIKELESLAQVRGYVVAEKYIDDGWSGALLSRPALDALRDDAGKHLFDGVLINDVDRLSRDIANLAVVSATLRRKALMSSSRTCRVTGRLAEHANTQEEVALLQHDLTVLEQEEERILIAYRLNQPYET
jgi:predicted site-specific integrase-resolvase